MLPKNCLLAAVDLGSNSFRVEVDRYQKGTLTRKDYIREPVRLGRGLNHEMRLDQASMERGWACLEQFGAYLRQQNVYQARAVATQTLRQAVNRNEFIEIGQKFLGVPIEIISGEQEALFIYTGVCALLDEAYPPAQGEQEQEKRFVIDIGGRSTELIVGQGSQALTAYSCPVGSVGLSMDFFANERLTQPQFDQAVAYARTLFNTAAQTMERACGTVLVWDQAYGASGTIGAVSNVLRNNQVTDGAITRPALDWIYEYLLRAGSITALSMPGLGDRRDVVGGGVSILLALFDTFQDLQALVPARGALRQGVLYDMVASANGYASVSTR